MEIKVNITIDFTVVESDNYPETPQDKLSELVNVHINGALVKEIDCYTAYKLGEIHARTRIISFSHVAYFDKTEEGVYEFKRMNGLAVANPTAAAILFQNQDLWK